MGEAAAASEGRDHLITVMSVPHMARQYRAWLLGGSAAAAAWGAAGGSVALADSKDSKKKDDGTAPYFDPDALERGAKALREINASPHAKQARRGWLRGGGCGRAVGGTGARLATRDWCVGRLPPPLLFPTLFLSLQALLPPRTPSIHAPLASCGALRR